jgi:hypothetical protein
VTRSQMPTAAALGAFRTIGMVFPIMGADGTTARDEGEAIG